MENPNFNSIKWLSESLDSKEVLKLSVSQIQRRFTVLRWILEEEGEETAELRKWANPQMLEMKWIILRMSSPHLPTEEFVRQIKACAKISLKRQERGEVEKLPPFLF